VIRWLWRPLSVRLGFAACVGCGAVLGLALWRAMRLAAVVAAAPGAGDADAVTDPAPSVAYPLARVLAAVAKDPFHPERRRPGAHFQLPADIAAAAARRQDTQGPAASLRVIGTAVAPDGGGFAMCAWAGGSPRILRVGERAGEWVLRRVTPGAAEFTTPGGQAVVVRVPKAGS
jgi:hypothetical protein